MPELSHYDRTMLEDAAYQFNIKRKPLRVLDRCGQWRFAVYAASGSLAAECAVFVVRNAKENGLDSLTIRLPVSPTAELMRAALDEAAARFDELATFIPEGGDLGLAGLDYRKK